MAELVGHAEGAGPDDLVLEVHRVEDARTVTQRLHVRADAWRQFLDLPRSASAKEAYQARREFWDWLAEEYADIPSTVPSEPSGITPRVPDPAWLREKHAGWQARH